MQNKQAGKEPRNNRTYSPAITKNKILPTRSVKTETVFLPFAKPVASAAEMMQPAAVATAWKMKIPMNQRIDRMDESFASTVLIFHACVFRILRLSIPVRSLQHTQANAS